MNEITQKVIEAIETLQKVVISEVTSSTFFETRTAETVKYEILSKNQSATEKRYKKGELKAHEVILTFCSNQIEKQTRELPEFEFIIKDDFIELSKKIKILVHQP